MNRISYTIAEAAETCGVSEPVIRRAIRKGDLVPHYPTSRPVLLADDLHEWISSSPTERKKEAS